MRAPKQKLWITVVPAEAPPAGMSVDDVALLLARLIGRQIAREHIHQRRNEITQDNPKKLTPSRKVNPLSH
ncbi:MAG: hypothetical protein ABF976_09795 [Acetobacter syzygii]|uniref:hypothetical protein n=1 Tax=Acetobacter syzygii TaxID=146476 RepID=UPI0024304524|nr:hypothetical protein [Acetobacter syzygii]